MEKNLIPKIAEMLGVEIGQRFKVYTTSGVFYFDNEYLNLEIDNEEDIYLANRKSKAVLEELLNGHWKITEKLSKVPTLTEDEKVILRNLPKEYKWIGREENDELRMFKSDGAKFWCWDSQFPLSLKVFNHLFQFVKKDQEPHNIQELLEEYEKFKGEK